MKKISRLQLRKASIPPLVKSAVRRNKCFSYSCFNELEYVVFLNRSRKVVDVFCKHCYLKGNNGVYTPKKEKYDSTKYEVRGLVN